MIIYTLVLVIGVLIILGIFLQSVDLSLASLFPGVLLAILWLAVSPNIAERVAALNNIEGKIEVVQNEMDRLTEQLDGTNTKQAQFTMNNDTPIAAIVQARLATADNLVAYKAKRYDLKAYIEAHCMGPVSPVGKFMGVCD